MQLFGVLRHAFVGLPMWFCLTLHVILISGIKFGLEAESSSTVHLPASTCTDTESQRTVACKGPLCLPIYCFHDEPAEDSDFHFQLLGKYFNDLEPSDSPMIELLQK